MAKATASSAQSSDKLRFAAIGIGGIFKAAHAKPLLAHPEVDLVAVCDVIPERASAFAAEHGVATAVADYRDVIKMKDVDAIDICTPNKFHSEIAIAALEAGKHVFTEKPDAINAKEAQRMADAAKRSGKTLMAMRNNRFRADTQFLKRYVDGGHMGDVYAGRCGWIRRRGIPGKGGWFTTKELSGGGPLIDLGVHFIDIALWLMGNPKPVAVSGATYRKFAEGSAAADSVHSQFGDAKAGGVFDVEDLAMGFIRFDNGASLQIEFSWASNVEEEDVFCELRGSRSGVHLSQNQPLKLFTEIEGTLCDLVPRIGGPRSGGHDGHLRHFVDVLRGRAKPINSPEDGVHMIQILTAIYESAQTGREVRLS